MLSIVAGRPHQRLRGPAGDPLFRRPVCESGQPACPQVSRCTGLSRSDRKYPALTGRSGTQRARRPLRPELAAPLGVCPLSQLMEGVGGSSRSLLSGDVAVFCCCTGALRVSFVGAARCAVPTDLPFFRPDISQVGADRGSVMRCRPLLLLASGTPDRRHPQHVAELLASSLPNSNRIPELSSWLDRRPSLRSRRCSCGSARRIASSPPPACRMWSAAPAGGRRCRGRGAPGSRPGYGGDRRDRLAEDDAQEAFLLDGFPRNVPQAETLKKMLSRIEREADVMLELVVDEDEVVRRLSGRRTCRRCDGSGTSCTIPPLATASATTVAVNSSSATMTPRRPSGTSSRSTPSRPPRSPPSTLRRTS